MNSKRPITPHKGGRTEQVHARITPADKAALEAILKERGVSLADWLKQKIEQDIRSRADNGEEQR